MGRHETFENAAPIADELLAGTILTRMSGHDPALQAISDHRAAYAAWLPHLDATSDAIGGSPEWHAAHAAAAEPMRAEIKIFDRLVATPPTTLAGLRAFAAYLPAAIAANGITEDGNDALTALSTMSRAVLALVGSGTSEVASDPVDWADPPPGFMASPAIKPSGFTIIAEGLRIELERLHEIALVEFERRTESLRERMSDSEAREREALVRAELFLAPLTAAVDRNSDGAKALDLLEARHGRHAAEGRVLASGAVHHDNGTVTYCDASGRAHTAPMAHWVAFVAMQIHARVSAEITRQTNLCGLSGEEMRAFESHLRRTLRSDAAFNFAFYPERSFCAAEAERTGEAPRTTDERAQGDGDLRALAPTWAAARDHYADRTQEQIAVSDAARAVEPPPPRDLPPEELQRQVQGWRERTGVEDAEAASSEALDDLCEIEDRIAELPAATLAGLKLKALVAQRAEDIDLDWPEKLGAGLVRDILAFVEAQAKNRPVATLPPDTVIADGLGLGAMPLKELAATHDVAVLIKNVAHAVGCQPRCKKGGRGGPESNAAGAFVVWIAEAMIAVEDAALRAMRDRSPSDGWDRETRLRVLAEAVVTNGDPDETRAFAHELLATVET